MRLRLSGISKRFGALQALADVELDLRGGEIHALLGENGAGKSTLMNVLYGLIQPDSGEIRIDDRVVRPRDPAEARALGIGMVHQHFTVVAALTTAENFALSLADAGLRFRPEEVAAKATALAERFGLDIGDLFAVSGTLSVGARQRLEILKALTGEARILVLDEPTAVLTPAEVAQLFEVLRALRAEGRLVLLITHKLPEVREIADRVAVLRRGRIVGGGTPAELSDEDLVGLMVGDSFVRAAPVVGVGPAVPAVSEHQTARSAGRESDSAGTAGPTLSLERVTLTRDSPPIDLVVRAGELVGIVGVDGNGQTELFEIVSGLRAPANGRMAIGGSVVEQFTPAGMQGAGLSVIPPDRRSDGLVAEMSVRDNLVLSHKLLTRFSSRGILDRPAIGEFARLQAQRYNVRASAIEADAGTLSGGNQQRIVVARALAGEPRLLLAVNPTRGLDIAAATAVYEALGAFVAAGNAVLLMTTDLDEALRLSDRVGVLFRHGLSPLLERPYSVEQIGLLMAGGHATA